jgi:predicted nucleotidyltransferase
MDVLGALRAAAGEVFAGGPVAFAYLFGSQARGDARADEVDDLQRLDDLRAFRTAAASAADTDTS